MACSAETSFIVSQGVTDLAVKAIHDSCEVLANSMPQNHRWVNSLLHLTFEMQIRLPYF